MKDIMNFVEGIGSIFNIMPTSRIQHLKKVDSSFNDDYDKLTNDWQVVGNDLRYAMSQYEKQYSTK